ncbi:MAG: hypothetical protein E7362_01445 [Clostridiales bacterium]|nr:hypothetical protein [Clostridiales bacterium]
MAKSIRTKKILMLVLSLMLACTLFIGVGGFVKHAKAMDSGTTDIAVYNDALYQKNISRPFWNSNVIYNETVLMTTDGYTSTGKLLYNAVDVIAVTNHDGTIFYDEGTHFTVSGNTITNIAMPHIHQCLTQGTNHGVDKATWQAWAGGYNFDANWQTSSLTGKDCTVLDGAIYTEGDLYRTNYIKVTYIYNPATADTSFLTKYDANYLGDLRTKLERGESISMVSIGDSITEGCSSTGDMLKVAPYQPGYTNLVENEIERVYGVNVNHARLGVGGTESYHPLNATASSAYGTGYVRNIFVNALNTNTFDLAIIAYGMNDQGAGRSKADYKANIEGIVNELLADSPDCNIIFVNTFPRNPDMDANSGRGTQLYHDYKAALDEISVALNTQKGKNVSRVVNMYAVGSAYLNVGKHYADISSSNCNHPNDSFIRTYAMNVMSVICNYDTVSHYEMNKTGNAAELFPFTRDLNGWSTQGMDYSGFTSSPTAADQVLWQKRSDDSTIATYRFGIAPGTHVYDANTKISRFELIYNGYNVNFNAYDVTKPIVIKYSVAPAGAGSFASATHYGLNLFAKLEDAFKAGHGLSNSEYALANNGLISLTGTNANSGTSAWTGMAYSKLYGKLRLNGNDSMVSDYFFPATYNTTTWDDQYYTVKINVGTTKTTVSVQGKVIGTVDVTRDDFPNGVAYLKVNAGDGNALFNFFDASADINIDKYNSSADGTPFWFRNDERGWTTQTQYDMSGKTYKDQSGAIVVNSNYGIEAISNNDPYSGMTLLNNAYAVNYKAIDVTKPFKLTYLVHPARVGDYVFALFDNIKTAFVANNGTWNGSAVGAKIWMQGSNTSDLTMNGYNLNNHVLFNGSLYAGGNLFSSPYDANNFMSKPIEVIFDIGTTATTVYVNNEKAGTLAVKRDDFVDGLAYVSLACPSQNATIAILAKAIEVTTVPTAVTNYTVTFDSNGGTAVASQTVQKGGVATTPTAPTRSADANYTYTFAGWQLNGVDYNFSTPVNGNITLVAKWTSTPIVVNYTVTFDSNGGTAVSSQTVQKGGVATTPTAPTKAADANYTYAFNGWQLNGVDYDFSTPVNGNITLTAKWIATPIDTGSENTKTAISVANVNYDPNTLPMAGYGNKVLVAVNFDTNTVTGDWWQRLPNASQYVQIVTATGETIVPYLVESCNMSIAINRMADVNGQYLISVGDVLIIKAGWVLGDYEFKETVYYKYQTEGAPFIKLEEGKLYSSKDGSEFDFAKDANGWSTYIRNNTETVTWHDSLGNTIIQSNFGKEAEWVYGDYSGFTLAYYSANEGAGTYVANFNAFDVTKPIQIEYAMHSARQGDYNFALFDDLFTALKAGNGTWDGATAGAKLWFRGSNADITQGIYDENMNVIQKQLNDRILFNAKLHYDKAVLTPYNGEVSQNVVVTYVIGTTNTVVVVNGERVGTLDVKQSDFKGGVAYLTLGNAWSATGWCAAMFAKAVKQDVVVDISSHITSTSMVINDGLHFNVFANVYEDITEPQLKFEYYGIERIISDYTVVNDRYQFTYDDLAPQYMNDIITISLTGLVDGVRQVVDIKTTSVRDYAMKIINSSSALSTEKAMAIDLLNYGALAQQYKGKDLDDLANKLLTDTQKANGSTFNPNAITSITSGSNATGTRGSIKWKSANLMLDDKVGIRFNLDLQGIATKDNVTIKVTMKGVTTTLSVQELGGVYYVEFKGIAASEYDTPIIATAFLDGQQTKATMTYSVNSWIKANYNHATNGSLAKALYGYGNSALTFVENDPNNVGDLEVEVPRDMNESSAKNEIITDTTSISFSDSLWETPDAIRCTDFDQTNSASQGYFISLPWGNYKFFAYVGIPANASASNKVPGMVLVHGGGGTAFYEWVDAWVARGYAAIAMCTDANIPDKNPANSPMRFGGGWTAYSQYTVNGNTFNIGPDNPGLFSDYNLPIEQQWGYLGIAKIILSNSFLRSFEGVDTSKIGITGISYGSILTSQATGYDDRFACAVPIYGSYAQDLGHTIFSATGFSDENSLKNELYNNYKLMDNQKTPFLFINSNKDPYFSILGQSKSSELIRGSKILIIDSLPHGHEIGANLKLDPSTPLMLPEIFNFVDSICLGTTRLPEITAHPTVDTRIMQVSVPSGASITSATMYYTDSYMLNDEATWYNASCSISGNRITLPTVSGAYTFFVTIQDSNGNRVSSRVVKDSNFNAEVLEDALRPYWSSNEVFNETGAFLGETGTINLLYAPTEITMVGQYNDVTIRYEEGVDYTISGNVMTRLAGSRMPYWALNEYFTDEPANVTGDSTMSTQGAIALQVTNTTYNPWGSHYYGKYTPYCPDGATNRPQMKFITISYKHNSTLDGLTLTDSVSNMANLHAKFDDPTKDTIQVLVIGDSVGEGCSSSGTRYAGHVGWDMPDAYDMVGAYISNHENKKVVVTNVAVGGTQLQHWVSSRPMFQETRDIYARFINALRRTGEYLVYGVDKGENVANNYYDLVLIRHGANDGGTSMDTYKAQHKEILDTIFAYNPNVNIVTISPFVHNELCNAWGVGSSVQFVEVWQDQVHAAHARGGQIGTADVLSTGMWILQNRGKFGKDFLTNNVNHANDYMNRWTAQLTLYAIYGQEYIDSFND